MKNFIIFFSSIFYLLLVSCTSSSNSSMDSPLSPQGSSYPIVSSYATEDVSNSLNYSDMSMNYNQSNKFNTDNSISTKIEQIIIYNANLHLETKEIPDTVNSKIMKIAEKYSGYSTNRSNKYIIIRVKAEFLKSAIDDISTLGEITDKSVEGTDMTLEYSDLNIKMDNLEKSRQRYLELLAKAENVETALKVEKELERLLFEIERTKGRMETISHLNKYSTITVVYYYPVRPGPVSWVFNVIYSGVKWLFVWN